MKTALVTGASSGIGEAICARLQTLGFRVAGLARWRKGERPASSQFEPVTVDLRDRKSTEAATRRVLDQFGGELSLLVNAAGFGNFAPHRHLSPEVIEDMIAVNLTAPLILCRLCLPALEARAGRIINIGSITARHLGKRGAAYAGTKAGLVHFSRNLFEEVRKTGVSVTSLLPDLTDTPFYDTLDFAPASVPGASVSLEAIATAVQQVIESPPGTVIEEVVLRPQILRIEKKGRPT